MAAVTIPIPGLLLLAQSMFNQSPGIGSTLLVDLFCSGVITNDGSLPSDFSICAFPGYAQVPIATYLVTTAVSDSSFVSATYSNNPISWSNAAQIPITVYGYLVTSADTGIVVWYQVFDSAYTIAPQNRVLINLSFNVFPFINYIPPTGR
jgi:hypothetical protein